MQTGLVLGSFRFRRGCGCIARRAWLMVWVSMSMTALLLLLLLWRMVVVRILRMLRMPFCWCSVFCVLCSLFSFLFSLFCFVDSDSSERDIQSESKKEVMSDYCTGLYLLDDFDLYVLFGLSSPRTCSRTTFVLGAWTSINECRVPGSIFSC